MSMPNSVGKQRLDELRNHSLRTLPFLIHCAAVRITIGGKRSIPQCRGLACLVATGP